MGSHRKVITPRDLQWGIQLSKYKSTLFYSILCQFVVSCNFIKMLKINTKTSRPKAIFMKNRACTLICVVLLTRQTFSFPGLQQDGPLSVQVSRLAAFTQVGLRNVLSVDAHAVYMLPGTKTNHSKRF